MKDLQPLISSLRVAAKTDPDEISELDATAREEWAYAAGLQIWVFGLPLLRVEQLRRMFLQLTAPMEALPFAPQNQLGHMRILPTADSDLPFTPNVDTLYSGSLVDLRQEPLVFGAPEMPGRYWSLQIADPWLSNLPYLGTRATGRKEGVWLLAGPDWDGEVPEGVTLYRSPRNTMVLALRVRVEGVRDVSNCLACQDGFWLTPLSGYLSGEPKPAPPVEPRDIPLDDHDVAYFTTLCRLLRDDPPYDHDASIVALMDVLGIPPGAEVDPDSLDPAVRRGLVRAAEAGPRIIAWKVKYRGRKSESMWNVDLTGGSFGTDYLARAEGAIQGLFVHDPIECSYFHTYHDGDGMPLDGSKSYRLRFEPGQIARTADLGFWSITGYGTRFTLIPNDYGRYSIQSSDKDLVFDADGGLTLDVGGAPPSGRISNWLATEPGQPFRLNYRVYLPDAKMLDPDQVDDFLPPVLPRL